MELKIGDKIKCIDARYVCYQSLLTKNNIYIFDGKKGEYSSI